LAAGGAVVPLHNFKKKSSMWPSCIGKSTVFRIKDFDHKLKIGGHEIHNKS
jgi:hypothetical protein